MKSEHAMGYIKGRFSSLRGLCQQIDNAVDHARALAWIKTCIVIHTLISFIESGSEDSDFVDELIAEGRDAPVAPENELVAESVRETRGQGRREQLKADLFNSEFLDYE